MTSLMPCHTLIILCLLNFYFCNLWEVRQTDCSPLPLFYLIPKVSFGANQRWVIKFDHLNGFVAAIVQISDMPHLVCWLKRRAIREHFLFKWIAGYQMNIKTRLSTVSVKTKTKCVKKSNKWRWIICHCDTSYQQLYT